MKKFIVAAVLLVWCATVHAKGPEITGPETVKIGGRCILVVTDIAECKVGWFLPKLANGAEAVQYNSGAHLIFFTGNKPGKYTFILSVCEKDDDEIEHIVHEVVVEGVSPPRPPPVSPPADPVPPVNPVTPVIPGARFGLSALMHAAAVANDNGPPDSKLLAGDYRSVASQSHATVQAMVTAQKNLNRQILGDRASAWIAWGKILAKAMSDLQRAGKLVTVADNVVAWKEIAAGLEAVK